MNKTEKLEILMNDWKKEYTDYNYFLYDGIINEDEWNQQEIKICYFLKEAYVNDAKEEDYSHHLLNFIREDARRLWKKVPIWTYAIQQAHAQNYTSFDRKQISKLFNKLNSQIAVVNIKKCDGTSRSHDDELFEITKKDKKFLKEELEIINPDVIICGNTFKFLKEILGSDLSDEKANEKYYAFWNDKIIINYYHPASHTSNIVNYYALSEIYKTARYEMETIKNKD